METYELLIKSIDRQDRVILTGTRDELLQIASRAAACAARSGGGAADPGCACETRWIVRPRLPAG